MLYLFIYLAIGGFILSGMLIGKCDTIFTKKTIKDIESGFDDVERIIFGFIMALMLIICWLPVVIFAIIKVGRDNQ